MKITVETADLKRALYLTGAEIKTRSPLPILGNLKLEAKDSSLTITGTNLDIFIIETIGAEIKEAGQITLPFTVLARLIDRITSKTVKISASDKEATVTAGHIVATFELLPVDEYPPTPEVKSGIVIECLAPEFIKPLAKVAHAMGDDSSRYTLMGVNLSVRKKDIDFAATNGTRLAQYTSGLSCETLDIIIPDSSVQTFIRNCGDRKDSVKITITDGLIQIEAENTKIISRLVEGKFPSYRGVIPEPGKNVLSCDRKELIEAVKTVSLFLQPPAIGVKLAGKGKKEIEVSCNGHESGKRATAMVLGSELSGQPYFEISLNYRQLLATLATVEEETVRIECSDHKTPILIREGAFKGVMVPVYHVA